MRHVGTFILTLLAATSAIAETIEVKYLGPVELSTYACQDVTRSSFVNRVCYDDASESMIILLNSTYYAYCRIPEVVVREFLSAESMGRFYNQRIKSNAVAGIYDC